MRVCVFQREEAPLEAYLGFGMRAQAWTTHGAAVGRKEKENKTMEMQKMIGVRYRDLIESADKIVNMHSAALRLEVSLKEMPDQWKRVEAVVKGALAASSVVERTLDQAAEEAPSDKEEATLSETSDQAAALLVKAPEQIWELLDRGEVFQAFLFFQRAKAVFATMDMDAVERRFPFIRAQWSSIESFETVRSRQS